MRQPIAWYREFSPCRALETDVHSFFSFGPRPSAAISHRPLLREIAFFDPTFCSPQFADGHASLVFELGRTCDARGWFEDSAACRGTVTGAMTRVGRVEGADRPEMIGVYFRSARTKAVFGVAPSELTDRAIAINALWGTAGALLLSELCELDEGKRIDRLETVLLARLSASDRPTRSPHVAALAENALRLKGRVTVEQMARAAGVSRQHLTREFRERIGIRPKLYTRLARFHAALAYVGSPRNIDWSGVAADIGYADQSHMIAEFREFSGVTPQALVSRHWFHPFIERARAARSSPRL